MSKNYSINFSIPKRPKKSIKFIIIHYTGMRSESEALKRLCDTRAKVSAHYFIKNNGDVLNLVPDIYTAWHAGESSWKKYTYLNKNSIGIEINNPGHDNNYKKFNPRQIKAIKKLLKHLIKKYKINSKNVLGHSDVAPDRKKDPGEKFPWRELAASNLCQWHNLKEGMIKSFRKKKLSIQEEVLFIRNLYRIGYSKTCKNRTFLIYSFQRKFRQSLINGKIDKECLLISKSLLKS